MTFILSVIGFIGSIGFYLGVLRQVYATPDNIQVKSIELERENKQLKSQVEVLTKMVEECNSNE
ncbi:MAG: hypothetical protein N4A35_17625 [Flavobacteriales bacterium]|nr:hypothetical protein [Flavobacteriales bacterium]